jgi:hypothetical protein
MSMKFAIFELSAACCATFCEGMGLLSKRLTPAVRSNAFRRNASGVLNVTFFKRSPRAGGIAG